MSHKNIQTKHHAFEFGKAKLAAIFGNSEFTADTYHHYINEIELYMTYLKATTALPLESSTEPVYVSENTEIETEQPSEEGRLIGVFHKNLSGGLIKHNTGLTDGPIFIGESWVRDHAVEEGDLVEIFDYKNNSASGIRVVKKKYPKAPTDIHEFKFGIVENIYDAGHTESLDIHRPFVIKKSIHGNTLADYRLTTDEIDKLHIQDGDIVDLAWYTNNPSSRKVIWKHKTESKLPSTVEQKMLNHTPEKESVVESSAVLTDDQFKGLTICLVGMDMYKDKFKNSVEERMGTFIHVDPKDSRKRRESTYDKADIIMLGLQQISHESSNHAIAYAKQNGILYGSFNGHGVGPFILELINILNSNVKETQ